MWDEKKSHPKPSYSLAEAAFSYSLPHHPEQVFLIKTSNKHLNSCPDHGLINITLRQVSLRGKKKKTTNNPKPTTTKILLSILASSSVFSCLFLSLCRCHLVNSVPLKHRGVGEQHGGLAQGKTQEKRHFPPKPQSRKKEALSQQEPAVKQVQEVWRELFPGGAGTAKIKK